MTDRKLDHIKLAFESRVQQRNMKLYYEPMLSAHPNSNTDLSLNFLGKHFKAPLWISSMTGGTAKAKIINTHLAKVANKFGLGMGLGSCRPLLEGSERLADFDLRDLIGDCPFYANLGVAQLEQLISSKELKKVSTMLKSLEVDGLIIHVNPLQEWVQPEGDRLQVAPIETIKHVVNELETNIIVKEVGQGFGPNSLISLMNLPIQAIDFAAHGGTNFTALELARHNALSSGKREALRHLSSIGHSAEEMIEWVNSGLSHQNVRCKEFIISGGITHVLDGHALRDKLRASSIIGMGSAFLQFAEDEGMLEDFVQTQIELLKLAKCYMKGK